MKASELIRILQAGIQEIGFDPDMYWCSDEDGSVEEVEGAAVDLAEGGRVLVLVSQFTEDEMSAKSIEPMGNYEFAKTAIQDLPATFYPGLLLALLEAAKEKKVFKTNGASIAVRQWEEGIL